jgi:heme oxygenase (mycobilin-producing)
MAVRIVSRRKVAEDKETEVMPLIRQLQQMAKNQPGYRSEETWRHLERKEQYLIVREWDSENDWYQWQSSPDRVETQQNVEALLGERTQYELYEIVYRTER